MIPITGKAHDLGDGFFVTRLCRNGAAQHRPFVFFDYFGPVDFAPGKGIDVRPHPHIGLATVTYLFEGSQMHRDTLGSVQEIKPGDVNWMTAGRGIAHSERTGCGVRAAGHRMHGIQSWVGLPQADEEAPPEFHHVGVADLPERDEGGVTLRLIAGTPSASPRRSRPSPRSSMPMPVSHRAARCIIAPSMRNAPSCHRRRSPDRRHRGAWPGAMLALERDEEVTLYADGPARVMLLGGAKLDGERHIWWNFVSSSKDRIERAKQEWKDGKFGLIPGDDKEFIPLPKTR
jgi:redox-sensitive bicupin YhaK (pirin superfamily)